MQCQPQGPCTALPSLTGESSGEHPGTGKGPGGALHPLVQDKDTTNGGKPVLPWHFSVPEEESLGNPEMTGCEVGVHRVECSH